MAITLLFREEVSISNDSIYERACLADGCYDMYRGQIAKCLMLMHIDKFNAFFGTDMPRNGVIDIYSDISGKDMKKTLKEKVQLCNHCIAKSVKWEMCGKNIELDDFAEWR